MSREEWLAAVLADAPPPSPAQIAILRQIFRPTIPKDAEAAPARQREPLVSSAIGTRERKPTDEPS